jgi:hypothetical protein
LRPFFRDDERPVNEAFTEVNLTARAQVFGEGFKYVAQRAVTRPLLETAVAGLVWRESLRQILPACATAQNPEHAVHHLAGVFPGAATAIFAAWRLWYQWPDKRPLFIS